MWEKNPGGSIGKCQTRPTNPFLFCWVCGTSASVFSIQLMLLMSDVARKIRPSNFVELLLANAQLHSIQFAYLLLLLPRLHIMYIFIYQQAAVCHVSVCINLDVNHDKSSMLFLFPFSLFFPFRMECLPQYKFVSIPSANCCPYTSPYLHRIGHHSQHVFRLLNSLISLWNKGKKKRVPLYFQTV